MGRVRPTTAIALAACVMGAASLIAGAGAGCSSPGANPPNMQDCTAPACLQPFPPDTAVLAQGSTPPTEDAGVVDAEVVVADGSGIPSAGPGPGIIGSTNVGVTNTNELG